MKIKDWYECLQDNDYPMDKVSTPCTGVDSFLSQGADSSEPLFSEKGGSSISSEDTRVRIASVDQLKGFTRVSSNTLVRMSEKDLWGLKEDEDGEFIIERLFDEDGNPLKA